jgi:hypothetical protein
LLQWFRQSVKPSQLNKYFTISTYLSCIFCK